MKQLGSRKNHAQHSQLPNIYGYVKVTKVVYPAPRFGIQLNNIAQVLGLW